MTAESPINAALFDVETPEASAPFIDDYPRDTGAMTEPAARQLCDQLNEVLEWHRAYPYHEAGLSDMSLLRQGWVVRVHQIDVPQIEFMHPMSCEDVDVFARNLEGEE